MPPVLSTFGTNYDYDYDTIQPLFFLDGEEEDFYPPPRNQLLPGLPGEDIWKKFELLPTPPLSPSRMPSRCEVPMSAADHLEAVSELLDEDCNPSAAFLQSFIIQDCMWSSSFAAATKLEQVVSERLASLRSRRDSSAANNKHTNDVTDVAAAQQMGGAQMNASYLQDLHAAATDCIDPSVVFPYTTLSEKSTDGVAASQLCPDSPPLSSSDSESEEEEEELEEEEIDVVTVDRRKTSRRSDTSQLVLKRSHIDVHQHNYAAPQPPASCEQPATKRIKATVGGRRCWSPRSDGDNNDDADRRRTHNVLERQRRNELKMSFLALRDEIPAVANNDKAAKVLILKKAVEFIAEMGEDEKKLLVKKEELRKRNRELRLRAQKLRTSH